MAEVEEPEIPVWYKGHQKWITGVTRRTTCDDVIYALLCSQGDMHDGVDVTEYEVVEQWRGVERPLRGRTKILKLWRTWGSMNHHVTLFIKRVESKLDSSSEVSHSRRTHRRSHRHHSTDRHRSHSDRAHVDRAHVDRAHVDRAHDREKRHREREKQRGGQKRRPRAASSSPSRHKPTDLTPGGGPPAEELDAQSYHQLMQTILEGEQVIQDQLNRIKEIDIQIENYETKLHQLRINKNGKNYLQEAYLRDKSDESTSTSSSNDDYLITEHTRNLEIYVEMCDNVFTVEERIRQQEGLIEDLSRTIHEESLNKDEDEDEEDGSEDMAQVKAELRKITSAYDVQEYQLEVLNTTIKECDDQLYSRQLYIRDLSASLAEMDKAHHSEAPPQTEDYPHPGGDAERVYSNMPPPLPPPRPPREGGKHLQPYLTYATFYKKREELQEPVISDKSKPDDSNSDTGMSSMHSDEAPPVLETLV